MAGSISGKVTNSGVGVSSVTVQASGPVPGTGTTNSSGNYQITNLLAGTYTVMVVRPTGRFTPPHHSVTLTQNQNVTGKNFQETGPSKTSKASKASKGSKKTKK
jgi:hypothetical protein